MRGIVAFMEGHESCKLDLAIASEEASRLFVEIYEKLETRKVDPGIEFDALVEVFRESLKGEGVGLLEALRDFRNNVVPNCLAIPHPLYLGLVNSSPLPGAALADHLISALNNNDGGVPQAALACEQEVIRAFKELYELPEGWNGLILPGGAFTTLQGLLLARAMRLSRDRNGRVSFTPRNSSNLYVRGGPLYGMRGLQRRLESANSTWSAFPALGEAALTLRPSKRISGPIGGKGIFLLPLWQPSARPARVPWTRLAELGNSARKKNSGCISTLVTAALPALFRN